MEKELRTISKFGYPTKEEWEKEAIVLENDEVPLYSITTKIQVPHSLPYIAVLILSKHLMRMGRIIDDLEAIGISTVLVRVDGLWVDKELPPEFVDEMDFGKLKYKGFHKEIILASSASRIMLREDDIVEVSMPGSKPKLSYEDYLEVKEGKGYKFHQERKRKIDEIVAREFLVKGKLEYCKYLKEQPKVKHLFQRLEPIREGVQAEIKTGVKVRVQ